MSGTTNRLIPANTTLLQPGARYYRVSDAINAQTTAINNVQVQNGSLNNVISTIQGQISTIQGQISTIQGDITTINTTLTSLQSQIDTINTRLTNAGIP